jgi:DnaK suppressor protein
VDAVLDDKCMERNKKWLEDKRARLQEDLGRMENAGEQVERPGLGTHMADQGSEVFEQAKGLAVRQQLQRTLELVNRALDKMASDTYGVCERCKQAIDPARLKAQPHATLCMPCQARLEQGSPSR